MAIGVPTKTAGNGRRRGRRFTPMHDINVTPFVDVMLVLLIIFMVSAPLLTVGVPIDLPKARAKPLQGDKEPLTVSIKNDGTIYLQNQPILIDDLAARLSAIAKAGYDERIYVRGDKAAGYGEIEKVLARLSYAGFHRIGLVNDQPPRQ